MEFEERELLICKNSVSSLRQSGIPSDNTVMPLVAAALDALGQCWHCDSSSIGCKSVDSSPRTLSQWPHESCWFETLTLSRGHHKHLLCQPEGPSARIQVCQIPVWHCLLRASKNLHDKMKSHSSASGNYSVMLPRAVPSWQTQPMLRTLNFRTQPIAANPI